MKLIKTLLTAIFLFAAIGVSAQTAPRVQKFEGGLSVGPTFALGPYHSYDMNVLVYTALSGRYNFQEKPWDVGIALGLNMAGWGVAGELGGLSLAAGDGQGEEQAECKTKNTAHNWTSFDLRQYLAACFIITPNTRKSKWKSVTV